MRRVEAILYKPLFKINEVVELNWHAVDDITENYLEDSPYCNILSCDEGVIKKCGKEYSKVEFVTDSIFGTKIIEECIPNCVLQKTC